MQVEDFVDRTNTVRNVWASSAYRSYENEVELAGHGFVTRIHHRKLKGKPMSELTVLAFQYLHLVDNFSRDTPTLAAVDLASFTQSSSEWVKESILSDIDRQGCLREGCLPS